jgi:ubiquinone/menaquinone biosynthesis C-methylase UbiE
MTANTQASKGHKGMAMEGAIATWYARNTRKLMEDYRRDAKSVARRISEGASVLEVAPGPGYLSIELAKLGSYHITGLDISATFVDIARANAFEAGVDIYFRQGDVARMPFDDGVFDFIVCRAAFKNFAQPIPALDEMYRVLKPGGKASSADLRRDVSAQTIDQHVDDMGLRGINKLITRWVFKFMLIKRAYSEDQFKDFVANSKFQTCKVQLDAIGLEVLLEK